MADNLTAQLVGGPRDGGAAVGVQRTAAVTRVWPASFCTRHSGATEYAHYTHQGNGRYLYAGACRAVADHGPQPDEWSCCCGEPECDGRGPWPAGSDG